MRTWSTPEVITETGITARRIYYWTEKRAIFPSISAHGSGSRIRWSVEDVERLHAIAGFVTEMELLVDHVPTDTIRKVWLGLSLNGVCELGQGVVSIRVALPERSVA